MTTTSPLDETTVTTYTYGAANRLLVSLSPGHPVSYDWDARGNLIDDGTFTYTYNAAGRAVRAESVTVTLVYTYNTQGLRVAQSVDGDETTFTWDLASPLAQVLVTSDGALNLYGLARIGEVRDGEWAYSLGDALGSVRQWADDGGDVTYAGGYTPFGVELWQEGSAASAWGFTGEWWDGDAGLLYLRARWYEPGVGRFTQRDPWIGDVYQPPTLVQGYAYVRGNPLRWVDPTGMTEQWWEDMLRHPHWRQVFLDSASRHNLESLTGLRNDGFAAVLASVVLIEGGNIGGASSGFKGLVGKVIGPRPEEIRIPIVACFKWLEIKLNERIRMYRPVPPDVSAVLLHASIGYQTEGIVNIDPSAVRQARLAGIEIYYYDTSEAYSDESWPLQFWRGQEQWVEYLAASFELVTKQAQELGIDISDKNEDDWPESIRAFAQWHKEGIVKAFGVQGNWYEKKELDEIKRLGGHDDWVADQMAAQESANQYYEGVIEHWWAALKGLTE